ncbi:aminotransferase class IV [Proteiniclasticum ruminis]|uniref:Branched-chain amino acid aminotransferase n=1 Tax=Proteiniclasticum ruminis TaxID=398199 RepID=A0A1I4XV79_9CLOT|nr:aminotransferase class IV [Proteiniclasticum ruminis]SFN29140.1 branched-chain amino acid aminotransferase [Proteiniclasticum ruminis]
MEKIRGAFALKNHEFIEADEFHFVLEKDNVYEVIRIIRGIPLFLEEHMERMEASLKLLKMPYTFRAEELKDLIEKLCQKNGFIKGNIKLVVNGEKIPALYLYFIPHSYPDAFLYAEGIRTKTIFLERSNPNAKVVRLSYKEKVTSFIEEHQIYEALLVNRDGEITEGSKSNVFFVLDETLYTPPLKDVLGGVTRKRILQIAEELSFPVKEKPVKLSDLYRIEAAFISGTSPKILPISKIDEKELSSTSHPMVLKLLNAYNDRIQDYITSHL